MVDIRYKYAFGVREYTGTVYRFTYFLYRAKTWQVDEVQARYPVGEPVSVSVKLQDPSEAVLEPGLWYGNFILPGIGLVILGITFVAKKFADSVTRVEPQAGA